MKLILDVGVREQIDHNEPGMPWVAHQRYERPDPDYPSLHDDPAPITGSRRVAYGATEGEARTRGALVAAAYPLGADIPNAVMAGRLPILGTYADEARARGWVRDLGCYWWDPAGGEDAVRVDCLVGQWRWWTPSPDSSAIVDGYRIGIAGTWHPAASEEDALRLALAAWPAVTS